jgi:CheY-like chemotaxis protein
MKYKILVIDDTPVIRDFLHEVLTDSGFDVDIAENGAAGLNMLENEDYTVVFCDTHMPVMNGLQTILKIKEIRPELPVVMTDSYPGKLAHKAMAAGAVVCLPKPFTLDQLRETLDNILKKEKQP